MIARYRDGGGAKSAAAHVTGFIPEGVLGEVDLDAVLAEDA